MPRPKGSKNRKTSLIALQAAEEGITPIEVMLNSMRAFWAMAEAAAGEKRFDHACAFANRACEVAKDAAPYIHPRLASVEYKDNTPPKNDAAIPAPNNYEDWLKYQKHVEATARAANGGDPDAQLH